MNTSPTPGKHDAGPGPRVPVLAPLAVLGLSALILALVVLSACSGSDGGHDADAAVPDVHEIADVPDTAEVDVDVGPAACEKPTVVLQSPEKGLIYKGKTRIKIQASHPCGISQVRVRYDFTGSGAKSADGADLGLVDLCTIENTDPTKTQFEDCKLATVFPEGSRDKEQHDISGDDVPDGPVKLRVSATATCEDCGATTGVTIPILLDNHGPTVTLVAPRPDQTECVKDELYIELWVEDTISGMDPKGVIDVAVDGSSIASPDTAEATKARPYIIHHHLEGVTDGSSTVTVTAEDVQGNKSKLEVDVCVTRVPTFRIVQKVGPRNASNEFLSTETRWIDYGKFEIDGELTPVVLLATRSGVYGSLLTPHGLPLNFKQLTNRSTEFVRAVPSKMGYPFAMVLVELADSDQWRLAVYEDPFSKDGHPEPPPEHAETAEVVEAAADAEVIDETTPVADVKPGDVATDGADAASGPPTYDWARLIEEHAISGTVTAAWMGELIDLPDDGITAADVVIGTLDTTTGLQIFRGDESGSGEGLFEGTPIEVTSVEATESIVVADVDGDGLRDITVGRASGESFRGFKQTRQYEVGKFSWTQNYVPTCPGDAEEFFRVADMPGLDVASLVDEEPGSPDVPEIVAVSSGLNTVTVLRRKVSGLPMSHNYTCLPTTFSREGSFYPMLLVGSQPSKVMILDLNHDDRKDLVIVNRGSGNLVVLPSFVNGEAFQVAESEGIYYNLGANPFRVWSFDLDQDDCPDLVVAHEGTSAYSWLRNPACDGNLVAAVDSPMPIPPGFQYARLEGLKFGIADVDLKPDQFDDVVLLTERIGVPEARPDGTETSVSHYPLWFFQSRGAAGDGVQSAAKLSGLVPSLYAGAVTDFALGNVAKTSHPDVLIAFDTPGGETSEAGVASISRVALAAMAWAQTGATGQFESLFDPAPATTGEPGEPVEPEPPIVPFYANPISIALGHVSSLTPVNMVDFVTVHSGKGTPGSDGYTEPMLVSYQVNPSSTGAPFTQRDMKVGLADGVGDGPVDATMGSVLSYENQLDDVLVANRGNQDISIFTGLNGGNFSDAIPAFGLGADPLAVTTLFWNDDCFLDIAVLTSENLAIAYWNEDALVYEPAAYFYGEDASISLTEGQELIRGAVDFLVSDTNHDCRDDLVVLNKSTSEVLIFTSTGLNAPGDLPPVSPVVFPTGAGPIQLAKGNFNADDCEDLAVLNGQGKSITTLIGTACTECTRPVQCP